MIINAVVKDWWGNIHEFAAGESGNPKTGSAGGNNI